MKDGVSAPVLRNEAVAATLVFAAIVLLSILGTAVEASDSDYDIDYDEAAGTIAIHMGYGVDTASWRASVYYLEDGIHYVAESAIGITSPDGMGIRVTDVSGSLINLDGEHYYIYLTASDGSQEAMIFEFDHIRGQDTGMAWTIALIVLTILTISLIILTRMFLRGKEE